MPESDEGTESKESKKAKPGKGAGSVGSRGLASRVEKSLKDADRLMKRAPEAPPEQKAMAQLEQAKISALLQLAEAIRESKKP